MPIYITAVPEGDFSESPSVSAPCPTCCNNHITENDGFVNCSWGRIVNSLKRNTSN